MDETKKCHFTMYEQKNKHDDTNFDHSFIQSFVPKKKQIQNITKQTVNKITTIISINHTFIM